MMNKADLEAWTRLHNAVNKEISKRLQSEYEIKRLLKRITDLERELAELERGFRELLPPPHPPAKDKAL